MTTLREQASGLKAEMLATVNTAKAAQRDLTDTEAADIEAKAARHDALMERAIRAEKAQAFVADLASAPLDAPEPTDLDYETRGSKTAAPASRWAKTVTNSLRTAAQSSGVKALLTGEVATPPVVEVVALPATPSNLLDLIPREPLNEHTYSYLRQTVRNDNAAVVADNALKPTSVYTFEEIDDRSRVIAHLSEPFPLRYLSDHSSMTDLLDGQMLAGVLDELSRQIIEGDGLGENFTGLLNLTGTTDVPFDTNMLTTVRRARTALENKGEAPTAWVFNPTDIETLDLMREDGATGGFLMDSGAYGAVFGEGVRRVSSLAVPAGTAILADWNMIRLRVRENVGTLAATQAGDLFDKNQVKLRCEGRFAVQYKRPRSTAIVHLSA